MTRNLSSRIAFWTSGSSITGMAHFQFRLTSFISLLVALSAPVWAQARPYPDADLQNTYQRLLAEIQKIPIFDHHAHPAFPDDPDVDAMAAPPGSSPFRERLDNPELVAAAKALWAYPYND